MLRNWIVQATVAINLAIFGYVGAGLTAAPPSNAPDGIAGKAYVVSEVLPHNAAQYQEYLRQVMPLIQKNGGRVLVNPFQTKRVIEGRDLEGNLAILQFPSTAARDAFWNSPEYKALKPLRQEAATARIIHIDG